MRITVVYRQVVRKGLPNFKEESFQIFAFISHWTTRLGGEVDMVTSKREKQYLRDHCF